MKFEAFEDRELDHCEGQVTCDQRGVACPERGWSTAELSNDMKS